MLTELRVSNFALIEQLHLNIPSGFVALTGETGAGKSLVVDALALLLGQRATGDQIRTGADEAELEAAFSIPPDCPVSVGLRALGVIGPDETDVIVRRVLSRSGRGRSYVNGRMVSVHELEQFAGLLVDIHGQHEQQSLLGPAAQLDALDHFGGLREIRALYEAAFGRWIEAQRLLETSTVEAKTLQEREDMLRYQVQEIRDAAIQPGEDESLKTMCQRLSHAERLRSLVDQTYELLYAGEGAVLEQLASATRRVKDLAAIDPGVEPWYAELSEATVVVQEVTTQLRRYRDGLEDDPSQLTALETRLARLDLLKKKYGGTLETVISRGNEVQEQVAQLENSQSHLCGLTKAAEARLQEVRRLATELSAKRGRVIAKLEAELKKEFSALHLGGARLAVHMEPVSGPMSLGPVGQDKVEFHFSANAGEPLQPLARVASGGESSRVMLALKTVLAAHDTVPILVFDEIDAGVGGAVAKAIGHRLRKLSQYHQVLCVTHLPQVASQAQAQILVEKAAQAQRTVTSARRLDRKGREEAIAKMLGGKTVTPTMRRAAAELLNEAELSC